MKYLDFSEKIPVMQEYDVIVCGAGVAGVAAAVSAARHNKSVLLLERSFMLGGLATSGLINYFVPACNGRGTKIIKGMSQEFFDLSVKYGFDTIPDKWKDETTSPEEKSGQRYVTSYSANIFALSLLELVKNEKVDLLFDCTVSSPVVTNVGGKKHCDGVVVQNKSGRQMYPAKMIIDTTGDADVIYRAGVECLDGKNYFTYLGYAVTLESCKRVVKSGNIGDALVRVQGSDIDLYGHNQPADRPLYKGTTVNDVTEYVADNQMIMLDNIRNDDRNSRDVAILPTMAQFRTTRCIKGGHIFSENDAYRHFDDSVGAICDCDRRDFLYEVPYRCLVNDGFDNMITAGRSACATGYGWDILRVIPPAIITGQASGNAAALAIDSGCDINNINIQNLQKTLAKEDVMIHFDDNLIPEKDSAGAGEKVEGTIHF